MMGEDDFTDCPHCGHESDSAEFAASGGFCPVCGSYNEEQDMGRHYTAGTSKYAPGGKLDRARKAEEQAARNKKIDDAYGGWSGRVHPSYRDNFDNAFDFFHDDSVGTDYYNDLFGDQDMRDATYDRIRSKFSSHHTAGSLRVAAIDFLAGQNTGDRDELLFRAHRHASTQTSQLPVPVAQRTVQAFVAAVNREILAGCGCGEDKDCEDCGAEAGEKCRPWCTGQAAHEDEKADKKKKSHRTAALSDFADELLFDS